MTPTPANCAEIQRRLQALAPRAALSIDEIASKNPRYRYDLTNTSGKEVAPLCWLVTGYPDYVSIDDDGYDCTCVATAISDGYHSVTVDFDNWRVDVYHEGMVGVLNAETLALPFMALGAALSDSVAQTILMWYAELCREQARQELL